MGKRSDYHIKQSIKLHPLQRYQYSISEILEDQGVFLLEEKPEAYAVSNFEGKTILAMWPAAEYAQYNVRGNWENFHVKEIRLENLEPILDKIEELNWHIDMFPVDGKTGYLVTVDEFINDLNSAAKSLT